MNDKLVKIQSELKAPKSNRNSFGNYNYRSCEDILEAVKPLLAKDGLTLTLSDEIVHMATNDPSKVVTLTDSKGKSKTEVIGGDRYYIKATAKLSDGADTIEVSALAREAIFKAGMDDAQITGSASSYARKYALNGLFAIDDTKDADTQDNRIQAVRVSQPTTYINPLGEAKEQLKAVLNEAGYKTATDMQIVIKKVLGKETVDSVDQAYEVRQAILEGFL